MPNRVDIDSKAITMTGAKREKILQETNRRTEPPSSFSIRSIPFLAIVGFACAWNLDPAEAIDTLIDLEPLRIDSVLLAIAFTVTALLCHHMDSWIENPRIGFILCACGATGGTLAVIADAVTLDGIALPACALISCLLLLAYQCYFMLYGIACISRLGMMKALFSLALWQTFSGIIGLVDVLFSPLTMLCFLLALSIIFNIAATCSRNPTSPPVQPNITMHADRKASTARPWRILVAQLLVLFSIHAFRTLLPVGVHEFTAIGFLVAALVIMAISRIRQRIFALRTYYVVSLMLMELSFLLLAFLPSDLSLAAGTLADASYVFFAILTFTVFGTMCQRFNISASGIFSLAFAMECTGNALGGLFGPLCQNVGIDTVHALIMLTFIPMVCFTCFFRESDFRTSWGMHEKESDGFGIVHYYESMADRCAALARQYGLSRREEDVLLMLAQRKTAQTIANELYISVPTVKTHTQHAYKKLGVHSRKELLTAIGYPAPESISRREDAVDGRTAK